MTKSSPLLLLVATLCLVITILAAFWIGLMPQRLMANIARQLKLEQGLVLEARSPRMGFDTGPVLILQAVSLARDGGFELTARDVRIDLGYAAMFGAKPVPQRLDFAAPVITLDVAKAVVPGLAFTPEIELHDAVIKLQDSQNGGVLAFSDINGTLSVSGGVKLDVSFLQNGSLTTLSADVESAERLADAGSPADITLASREKIVSWSGRLRVKQGLSLDGQMTLEGSETQTLFAWLGMPLQFLQGAGEFKLTSGLSTQGLVATLSKLTAQIGGQEIAGDATLKAGADRVAVTADITTPSLTLLPDINLLASAWSEKPLPFADLAILNADIHLSAENLILREQPWGPAEVSAKVLGGSSSLNVTTKDTTFSLSGTLAHSAVDLDLALVSKSADAKILLGGLAGFDALSGPVDLSLKAKSGGNTVAALVSTLKGKLAFATAKATLATTDIAARMNDPGEGWPAGKSTLSVTIDAEISDGIATLSKADLGLASGPIKLKGEIDLLRQAFDLRPSPKGKVQAITGNWTKPLFAADAGNAPPLRPVTTPAN